MVWEPFEITLSPRRCLICEEFIDVGEFGAHVFGEHSEKQVMEGWPGGIHGLIGYLEESVKQTLKEIDEQVDVDLLPDEQKQRLEMMRAVLVQMRMLAQAWREERKNIA